jgi:hypothetical protein
MLRSALFGFKARISFVDDESTTATSHDFTVTVAISQRLKGRFHFHGTGPDVR